MSLLETVRTIAPYLESWLELQRDRQRVPGIQAAIRVGGELVMSCALGLSNVETGERLTTDHLFHVASHSKTFTATACFQLIEAGKLRLDDVVATWLPQLASSPLADVTVRELLGHLSGVNRDGQSNAEYWQLIGAFPDTAGLIERASEAAVYLPNEHFKYTNIGYGILGLVVEAASGEPYADYCRTHITEPIGLTNTGAEVPAERVDDLAGAHSGRVHGADELFVIPHTGTGALAAATGFYSTAEEITAYLSAHAFGCDELVSDASKRLMQRRESTLTKYPDRGYGLGMMLQQVGERWLVGHSGGWPGMITFTGLDPKTGLCVSVLTNSLAGLATEWALGLVKLIDLAVANEAKGAPEVPEGIKMEEITGRYANLWGLTDLALLGGRLMALLPTAIDPSGQAEELSVTDANRLTVEATDGFSNVGEPTNIIRDETGRVVAIHSGGATSWRLEDYERMIAAPGRILTPAPLGR